MPRFTILSRAALKFAPATLALLLLAVQATPAAACGSLLAPNGAIRLSRAATLVDWHDGVERYMTSFTYQGNVDNVGWIVPLPANPEKIEEGGGWTLQRLVRETHPLPQNVFLEGDARAPQATAGAQVLQQVRVQALDITVVKGSGDEIVQWGRDNGFFIDKETEEHLLGYAKGSPFFMAAKYDTAAARARGQLQGDGAPVLITMKIPHPWIPFEVLALDAQQTQADLYLLTDTPVYASDFDSSIGKSSVGADVPNAAGLKVAFQEKMNAALYKDLSTDKNMGWVRSDSWLTYLTLDAPDTKVTYDMGVSSTGVIRIAPYGTAPMAVVDGVASRESPVRFPLGTPQVALTLAILLAFGVTIFFIVRAALRVPARETK
ncbi:MAG TPA: DUF2330 domain-containing protein [Ktedonobacterales bacterium]|jgi:hypothetical protein